MWRWVALKLRPYLQLETKVRDDTMQADISKLQATLSKLQDSVSTLQSEVSSLRDEVFRLRDELAAVVGFFGLVVIQHVTGETEVLFATGVKEEYRKAAATALQKRDEAILAHAVKALVVTIEALDRRKRK